MKKKLKGFTLVELVIVIAIVIILSVVSVPIYRGYTKQAKMSEGYALLGTILSAQKTYYGQYGNFLWATPNASAVIWTSNNEVLGINAIGNKYFTEFAVGDNDYRYPYHFRAHVVKPEELRSGSYSCLSLYFNITSGSLILEKAR